MDTEANLFKKHIKDWYNSMKLWQKIIFFVLEIYFIYIVLYTLIDYGETAEKCQPEGRFWGQLLCMGLTGMLNPFQIRITPISFLRGQKDWKENGYDFFNMYVNSVVGMFNLYTLRNIADKGRGDCLEGSGYPYPLIYLQMAWDTLCGIIFAVYMAVVLARNIFLILRTIFSKNHRSPISNVE
mmetsp:Transcript_6156/g.5520  ORF Transcript_6156/g.5520 Transcript_6156/m.5520 type:complete len:183 (+) Transcript_6156:97-645(+)